MLRSSLVLLITIACFAAKSADGPLTPAILQDTSKPLAAAFITLDCEEATIAVSPLMLFAQKLQTALSDDTSSASMACAELREAGPTGLDALLAAYPAELKELRSQPYADSPVSAQAKRLRTALEKVARQYDAHRSGLYWYTDFDLAKAEARRTGRPLLSLRLLGTLDQDCSCANSRFFRTALYANAQISAYLHDHFVLHWQSVRPVPKITIDFGDGRKIERTITGNSIHYVLDCNGRLIDALPGLYGPQAFLRGVLVAEKAAHASATDNDAKFLAWMATYHEERRAALKTAYATALAPEFQPQAQDVRPADGPRPPTAKAAGKRAEGKGMVEMPMVRALDLQKAQPVEPDADANAQVWTNLAARFAADSTLDASSRDMVRSKYPQAALANTLSYGKAIVESPLMKIMRNFQNATAMDTARNEFLFHYQIHQWLKLEAGIAKPTNLAAFNERVYADLFLTPSSDPWLGLVPANTYTGLDNDGLVK